MAGNVWEWCQDWYAPSDEAPQADPKGPEVGVARVLRGGSWHAIAGGCRSAARGMLDPTKRYGDGGFRVAVDLE
jgi:sulfatase modifying factor 1